MTISLQGIGQYPRYFPPEAPPLRQK
ncbi:hypothetical protein MTBSS4_670008 [Magnetospirillum sp. SS-4]|nr:hypothetical protein MTBSS4_670008 [Magnetospirillum sp. SS-4]